MKQKIHLPPEREMRENITPEYYCELQSMLASDLRIRELDIDAFLESIEISGYNNKIKKVNELLKEEMNLTPCEHSQNYEHVLKSRIIFK